MKHGNFWPQVNDSRFKTYIVHVDFGELLGTPDSKPAYSSTFPVLP